MESFCPKDKPCMCYRGYRPPTDGGRLGRPQAAPPVRKHLLDSPLEQTAIKSKDFTEHKSSTHAGGSASGLPCMFALTFSRTLYVLPWIQATGRRGEAGAPADGASGAQIFAGFPAVGDRK